MATTTPWPPRPLAGSSPASRCCRGRIPSMMHMVRIGFDLALRQMYVSVADTLRGCWSIIALGMPPTGLEGNSKDSCSDFSSASKNSRSKILSRDTILSMVSPLAALSISTGLIDCWLQLYLCLFSARIAAGVRPEGRKMRTRTPTWMNQTWNCTARHNARSLAAQTPAPLVLRHPLHAVTTARKAAALWRPTRKTQRAAAHATPMSSTESTAHAPVLGPGQVQLTPQWNPQTLARRWMSL